MILPELLIILSLKSAVSLEIDEELGIFPANKSG
jgi:hypothetical protein